MAFTFNKAYGEILPIADKAMDVGGLSDERREWLLKTLRKTAAMDAMSEFLKGLDRNSDYVLREGYVDALSVFLKFAKNL